MVLILRQKYPYIRVQSTKFPKESGLILSKRSARILTREKHSLWFAQITFRQCFERSYHMEGSTRRLKLGSIPTIWKKPTTSPETSSRQRREASEYKTSREVYRITVIRNKTRRKANIRYIIHARLRFFVDKVLKEMQEVKSVVTDA